MQDLYIEKINPDNPLQYEYMGEWRDMDIIEEVIKVNGGEDVILDRSYGHILSPTNSLYRIGSISKVYTATIILKLVEEGNHSELL